MRTESPGANLGFAVPLVQGGEPFVPDGGQVYWSLRGQDGSVLVAPTLITGIVDTQAVLTVLAANNTVAGDLTFEKRTITVTGALLGVPFSIRVFYRLQAWINMSCSTDEVRAFMGIDVDELPDDDIDLATAYLDVAGVVTQLVLDAALGSGGVTEISANRAIVARAVVNVIPSVQARMLKSESDGTRDIDRFKVDFAQLLQDAKDRLGKNINDMVPTTNRIPYVASGTSSNVDPIKGS